jgi:acetyl esterase/lipase
MQRLRMLLILSIATVTGVAQAQAPKGALPEGVQASRNLDYGKNERNKLDVYVPKSDKPLPLVIWIHGGGWEAGSKETNPALSLLARGYAVAGINYRYSKQAVFPAQIQDCKAAIRYLRDNAAKFNLNPEAFAVWGASAGGHLSALVGTTGDVKDWDGNSKTSSAVKAVVNWFGPTDLAKLSPPGIEGNPISKLLGGDTGTKSELAKQANPITHINKGDAPMLIIHGDNDKLVPLSQSQLLHDALVKNGLESELLVFKKAGHGDKEFISQVTAEANRKKLEEFLAKHLKSK